MSGVFNCSVFVRTFIPVAMVFLGCHSAKAQCNPEQIFKILAEDGAVDDRFGRSVAISGTTAIVGAWRHDDIGAAYLFDTTTGQQIAKLLPDDGEPDDRFGRWVGISGTTAIVGAALNDDNGVDSGSAYLFNTTTGQQIAKLLPEDGAADDNFGGGVAISNDTAIVGARGDDDNGENSGSVYVFDITTGQQISKLLPDDGGAEDEFGERVSISGNTAIVGVLHDDDNGFNSGAAYLFDTTTGQQFAKLLPDDGAENDFFGGCVAINGTTAIVGARRDDDNGNSSGSAYLFDSTTGKQIAKLLPDDGELGDLFGGVVAINGNTAIIGATGDDDNGAGAAYLFDITSGQQIAKILSDDGAADDFFGGGVAISNDTAIVGARGDDDNGEISGSAYVFDISSCVDTVLGDVNLDGEVNLLDVAPFVDRISSGTFQAEADINQDGVVDLLDVQPFVDLLTG